jgi:predicted nucleotidyltransferase/biotin operon repressor
MLPLEQVFGDRLNVTVLRQLSQVAGGISGNGLARRLGLQQSAVRKALERLVERGLVTRADVGRTAAYALDARREVVRRVVLPAFRAEARLGERLRGALQRAAAALRPRPAAVVLYGSVARGAAAPGDVDLLVVLAQPEDEEPVRAALLDAVRPVELRFQLAVHPVVMTAADLADRQADPLVAEIAADGLLLSGRAPGPLRRVRTLPAPARQRPVESAASGGAPVATASVSGAPHARGA